MLPLEFGENFDTLKSWFVSKYQFQRVDIWIEICALIWSVASLRASSLFLVPSELWTRPIICCASSSWRAPYLFCDSRFVCHPESFTGRLGTCTYYMTLLYKYLQTLQYSLCLCNLASAFIPFERSEVGAQMKRSSWDSLYDYPIFVSRGKIYRHAE